MFYLVVAIQLLRARSLLTRLLEEESMSHSLVCQMKRCSLSLVDMVTTSLLALSYILSDFNLKRLFDDSCSLLALSYFLSDFYLKRLIDDSCSLLALSYFLLDFNLKRLIDDSCSLLALSYFLSDFNLKRLIDDSCSRSTFLMVVTSFCRNLADSLELWARSL